MAAVAPSFSPTNALSSPSFPCFSLSQPQTLAGQAYQAATAAAAALLPDPDLAGGHLPKPSLRPDPVVAPADRVVDARTCAA